MKHLKTIFACLLMAVLSIGQVWADEVTFSYSDYKGQGTPSSGSSYTMVKTDVSINETKFNCGSSATYAQFFASGVTTITPASGVTVTQIVLTASGTSYTGYQSGGTMTWSTGSSSVDGSTVTWTGSATSAFTLSHNKQIRWTSIVVTYSKDAGAKTLTGVTVSGTPTKSTYEAGELFDPAGLTVTGTYSDETTGPITSGITWAYNPSQTLALNQTSIGVIATVGEIASPEFSVSGLTVTAATPKITIDGSAEGITSTDENQNITAGVGSFAGKFKSYSGGVMFTSGTGYIYNTASFGYIRKITINYRSGGSNTAVQWISMGDAALDSYAQDITNGVKYESSTGGSSNTFVVDGDYEFFRISVSSKNLQAASIVIEYDNNASAPKAATPTFPTGDENFVTSTSVTLACTTEGAKIYYTTNGDVPTSSSTLYNGAIPVSATTTIKAIAVADGMDNSNVAEKTFTKATILTVAEALTIIEGLDNKTATTAEYYVSGVVSTVTALTVDGTGEYYISADGTKTSELQVYKGKWVGGANFTSTDQLIEGDDVTIKGKLKKYNSYKELDQNNEVVLYKLKARLAWSEESYEADLSSSNTFPSLTNTNGVSVSYSSTNTDAATINPSTGAISLVAVGSTTIKATFTGNETYKANEVSYTLNVSNSVIRADISFEENGGSDVADLTNQSNLPDPLPTITKAGYNFGGWWTTSDFQNGTEAVAGDAVTSTDPITLYAKWLNPYTVTEALTMIDALADNGETGNVYVFGIVCTAPSNFISGGYLTYYISVDGTETNRLQVYKGKNVGNIAFTDKEDVKAADQVIVYGPLKKFKQGENIIPEFNTGNYLYSLSRKAEAGIEWSVASFDAYIGESNTFPTLTNPNSLTVAYSSSNETAATIDPATGAITLGTTPNINTTITASFAGNSSYKAAEVSYTLNVYNPTNPGTITYEENGGSEVADVTTSVDNFPDPLPEPTKENYIFAGWWTTSTFNDGTQAVAGAPMDGNVILYAKWTEIPVWAYTYTSNVTLSTEGGTSASAAKVKFYGEEGDGYDAIKAGTGSAQGAVVVNVPAGATALHFHAYGWTSESVGLTVTAPAGVTVSPATEISINSNSGITSNSPFTLAEGSDPKTEAYYAVSLSGNTEATNITISATSGKRFVLFGVNQEGGLVLESISITGTATALEYTDGQHFDPAGLGVTGHYSDASTAPITEGIIWAFDPDPLTEGTTSVSVTATAGGFTSAAFVVGGLTVAGAAPLSPWASVYTSNVTLSTEGGTSASAAKVKFYGEEGDGYDAIKAGTGSAQGAVVVNVPAGATALHFHAYGWSSESLGLTVTAPAGVTVSPATEISINSNSGIASNSPFTLAEGSDPKTDAYYAVSLSGNTEATNITISATSGKRFVLFGVNQEGGVIPVLKSIEISGDLTKKSGYKVGDDLDLDGLTVSAIYTLNEVDQAPVDVTSLVNWSYDPLVEGQTSVTITATLEDKSDDITISDLEAVASADPKIYVSTLSVDFGSVEVGEAVPANKTITVTLTNVAAATATLGGTNPEAFSISKTALVDGDVVTISVIASTVAAASYSATITITDDAAAATEKVVNLSFAVTEPAVEETPVSTTSKWVPATEITDGMQVLIVGVNNSDYFAMGAQANNGTGNNRLAVPASVDEGVLTPDENTMAFTVVEQPDGSYALQTSNDKYLYAASSSNNYLKTKDELDDNGKWTLSVTSAVANGTYTHKMMQFNSSSSIFACYTTSTTTQKPIALYVPQTPEPPTPVYTEVRTDLTPNAYYTMCLDKAVASVKAGSIWKVLSKAQNGTDIILEEVPATEAGRPYIIYATETTFEVEYTGGAVGAPVNDDENNGLIGSFSKQQITADADNYIIYNSELYYVNSNNVWVGANRAYLNMSDVPAYNGAAPAPGRRRVTMAAHGPQTATGIEDLNASEKPMKMMINGQIFILRGEKMYDTTGRLVK